jgi:hypothetical protein
VTKSASERHSTHDVIPNGAEGPVRDLTNRLKWHGRRRARHGVRGGTDPRLPQQRSRPS